MLALSSVCGVGVDTYPLVDGASHPIRVRSIIEDVISLANVRLRLTDYVEMG